MGFQFRKWPVGLRARIQALLSVATITNERWATDMCRVWCGCDNWATLTLVINFYTLELLGWHLSHSGRSMTAELALEQALIARYGHLGRVQMPFLLRSDNGLVFTSRSYTTLVKSYGLRQEFITPYSPEQNAYVERFNRTVRYEWLSQYYWGNLEEVQNFATNWMWGYNHERPNMALGEITPMQRLAMAA